MKKLLSIILCLLLLAGCAETYDGPTEPKSVLSSTELSYIDNEGNVYETLWTEYSYDIYGNLAVEIESRNDEPSLRTVYRYYEDGSTKSVTQFDLTSWFPRLILHGSYTYDEQGRQTKLVQWFGLDRSEQTTTYDDENHTITTEYTDGRTVVHLDAEGRPLRSESEHPNGSTSLIEHEYQGQTHITRYYQNGVLDTISETTYDEEGRTLTWYQTKDGKRELIWRYEYGENYDICYYESDNSTVTTGYNDDGTVKAVVETDGNDRITSRIIYRYTDIQVPAKEETP